MPFAELPASLYRLAKPRKTSSTRVPKLDFLSGRLICEGASQYKLRQRAAINCLVVHRCGVAKGLGLAVTAYRDQTKYAAGWYTKGAWPYHWYILPDGTIYECLPALFIAPAALKALNESGLHIALEGDFRKMSPTSKQESALKCLVSYLRADFKKTLPIRGHTDEAGASSNPNKRCPGHLLKLPK